MSADKSLTLQFTLTLFDQYRRIFCICTEELNSLVHWMFNLLCTYITDISLKNTSSGMGQTSNKIIYQSESKRKPQKRSVSVLNIFSSLNWRTFTIVCEWKVLIYVAYTHKDFRSKGLRTFRIPSNSNNVSLLKVWMKEFEMLRK